jgi:hypothetical protein
MIFQRDSSCPDSAVRVRPPQAHSRSACDTIGSLDRLRPWAGLRRGHPSFELIIREPVGPLRLSQGDRAGTQGAAERSLSLRRPAPRADRHVVWVGVHGGPCAVTLLPHRLRRPACILNLDFRVQKEPATSAQLEKLEKRIPPDQERGDLETPVFPLIRGTAVRSKFEKLDFRLR